MKIVFFGTSEYAVPALSALIKSDHEVCLVVTQPDRKKGRFLHVSFPPIKETASAAKIEVIQPEKPDAELMKTLRARNADLFVVIAYGHILKKELIGIPRLYSVNIHSSLLPKYRGAAPVNWAVMNGEKYSGVSVIRMNEFMDEGDLIARKMVEISGDDTALSLNQKLADEGAGLLINALPDIENGKVVFEEQDNNIATYARKLAKKDGIIDWHEKSADIINKVRGLIPWPMAYTFIDGKKLDVWSARAAEGNAARAGEIMEEKERLIVSAEDGLIEIEELQLEGKKRMKSAEFLRGYRLIKKGGRLGN